MRNNSSRVFIIKYLSIVNGVLLVFIIFQDSKSTFFY